MSKKAAVSVDLVVNKKKEVTEALKGRETKTSIK